MEQGCGLCLLSFIHYSSLIRGHTLVPDRKRNNEIKLIYDSLFGELR